MKIGPSHMMYSNNILNFQVSTTILNAHTKKLCKLIEGTSYIQSYKLIDNTQIPRDYANVIFLTNEVNAIHNLKCAWEYILENVHAIAS